MTNNNLLVNKWLSFLFSVPCLSAVIRSTRYENIGTICGKIGDNFLDDELIIDRSLSKYNTA